MYRLINCLIVLSVQSFGQQCSAKDRPIFFTTEQYKVLKVLEDNADVIASEIPAFDINKTYFKRDTSWPTTREKKALEAWLKKNIRSEWVEGPQGNRVWFNYPLVVNDIVIDRGAELFPRTIELLNQIPGKQVVGFSLVTPGSRLAEHRDPTGKKYGSMAANMLLTDSANAYLIVEGRRYHHRFGKMVIFDSTKLHTADNNDESMRVILYIDFKTTDSF